MERYKKIYKLLKSSDNKSILLGLTFMSKLSEEDFNNCFKSLAKHGNPIYRVRSLHNFKKKSESFCFNGSGLMEFFDITSEDGEFLSVTIDHTSLFDLSTYYSPGSKCSESYDDAIARIKKLIANPPKFNKK